jgi:hypothetical protein
VAGQTWRPLQLVLVLHGLDLDPGVVAEKARAAGIEDVVVLATDAPTAPGACLNLGVEAAGGGYLGVMDEESLRADGLGIYAADRYSFVATHNGGEPPADAQVAFYGSPEQHVLF